MTQEEAGVGERTVQGESSDYEVDCDVRTDDDCNDKHDAAVQKAEEDGYKEPFSPKTYKYSWRRKIAANPVTNHTYRMAVGTVGGLVTVVGVIAIPAPGPGWLIVFAGLGILATEFMWAAKLLRFARRKVHAWNEFMKRQPWWFQGLVGLATFLLVLGIFWVMFYFMGIPDFMPDFAVEQLEKVPGLG